VSAVAVSEGTTRQASVAAGPFRVSEVVFPPGRRLPWHAHPYACLAVVVDGVVGKRFRRLEADAGAGALISMPPEEPHEDRFGRTGAAIVVVEAKEGVGPDVTCSSDGGGALVALRIRRELAAPDAFTPLAVEGLALELFALAGRSRVPARPERWVERVHATVQERFRERLEPRAIAAELDVHPAHLHRAFRARYGETLGEYVRRLRLEWAAREMVVTDKPLAFLAVEAGFCDQSHFTRAFKRQFGVTPARFRALQL
jgi:AraC family transcriptional regulator